MTRAEVQEKVYEVIADQSGVDGGVDVLLDETPLGSDGSVGLDMDSLDTTEMTVALEDLQDGLLIPDDVATKWRTVGDVVDYMATVLE